MKMQFPLFRFIILVVAFLAMTHTSAFALTPPPTGAVAAGGSHTVSLKSDGTVWTWGGNNFGQLGDGTTNSGTVPVRVSGLTSVVAVAAGTQHTVILKSDGTVWTWGYNFYGQLGDGTTTNRTIPTPVNGLSGVVAVAAGGNFTVALKSDGTMWAWGRNAEGQLGDGTTTLRTTAVQVSGLSGVLKMTAGAFHVLALKNDGTVYAWGSNFLGQLGDGTSTNRTMAVPVSGLTGMVAVSGGYYFSMALKSDGTVWSWGSNAYGQLGDGSGSNRTTAVRVNGLTGVVAVAAGESQGVAAKSDGSVWTWGDNTYGQLGDGTTTQRIIAVQVSGLNGAVTVAAGARHTLALKTNGTVFVWGSNSSGQFGDGTMTPQITAVQVSGLTGVVAAAAGNEFTLAVKSDGTVWACGYNYYGQLADGSTVNRASMAQVSGLNGITKVAAGRTNGLAVKGDGTVWTWGDNGYGQLGNGTKNQRTTTLPANGITGVVSAAAGWYHSIALKSDGTVWAWGGNGYGQLGDGTTTDRTTPVIVSGLSGIVAIAAGHGHTVALKSDGTVWSWGYNYYGQLIDGTTTNRSSAIKINGLSGIVAVSAGEYHSMALKSDGTVWTWGDNSTGQLGDGTTVPRSTVVPVSGLNGIAGISGGYYFSAALKSDGTVWTWGNNIDGTSGTRNTPTLAGGGLNDLSVVVAGSSHVVAIKNDGTLRGWGAPSSGQLAFFASGPTQSAIRLVAAADDTDQDGISDAWEIQYFGNLSHSGGIDGDSDGLTDVKEFTRGSDPLQADGDADKLTDFVDLYPNDFYNQVTPSLMLFSGGNQTAAAGTFNVLPFDVAVWNSSANTPLVNAPVTYSVNSGEGYLATSLSGSLRSSQTVRADQDGMTKLYFKHGNTAGLTSTIKVAAGNAQLFIQSTTNQQSQTITFPDPGPQIFGTPVSLGASASSGLPVSYTVVSGPAAIANGVASFSGTGAVTISASQPGNSNYAAATDILRTFNVSPGIQSTVTLSPANSSINAGQAITFTASGGTNGYSWGGGASGSGSTQTITFNTPGTFNVTVFAPGDGNYSQSNTATAVILVADVTPPMITSPGNLTAEATGATGASVSFASSASDLVDGSVTVIASPTSGSTFPLGVTTVTLSATDANHNTATTTFTVTILDTAAPVLTLPGNQTVEATGPTGAVTVFSASALDMVSGDGLVHFSPDSGSTFPFGETPVTASATDAAGNVSTGTFTVTVQDTTAPVITVPDTITAEADRATGAIVTLVGSASDLVSGSVAVTYSPASDSIFPVGTTIVTATATDATGNVATTTLQVKVVDTIAPVLSLPADTMVEAAGSDGAVATFAATAVDTVNGNLSVSYSVAPGSLFPLGTTIVTVTAVDNEGNVVTGNFTVTVRDTVPPVFTTPADQTLEANNPAGTAVTYSTSALDQINGMVPVNFTPASGSSFPIGVTTVTATATDATGNTTTRTFNITIRDTTPPVITSPGNLVVEATANSGAAVIFAASADDLGDGAIIVSASRASGSTFAIGTAIVTLTARDAHNNQATKTFTVTVRDTTPPALTLPADKTVEATGPTGAKVTYSATAVDLVNGSRSVAFVPVSGTIFAIGTSNVTATSKDVAGNIATGTFNVTVRDTTAPVITIPASQTLEATGPGGAVATFSASATDKVSGSVTVSLSTNSDSIFPIGTNTVTATAVDEAGNTATRTFTVKVRDTTKPVITLPANQTVQATTSTGAVVTFTATAVDIVSGTITVTFNRASGSKFAIGTTTVTATAKDAAGNTATGTFTITVVR